MTRIDRSVLIDAPPGEVWAVISDLDAVPDWNPNIRSASCGPVGTGLGATRICEIEPRGSIREVVSHWSEGREVWFAIGSHGGIRSADMGLIVQPTSDGTIVEAVADYHLALGPVGPVIDQLTTRRLMTNMLERSLDGLKKHVEDNRKVSK